MLSENEKVARDAYKREIGYLKGLSVAVAHMSQAELKEYKQKYPRN